MTKSTKVLFNNHSSLLIKRNEKFLLTDPWFQTPAFGSWLPTFPPYLHPIYVSSLKDKLTVLVSHGHDDHFDDKLLTLFDKDTRFVTAKFRSPSVKNRLKRIGFENLIEVDENGAKVDSEFFIKSFIDEKISHDDAKYSISTEEGIVIHANDNWQKFNDSDLKIMKADCLKHNKQSVLFFSQTNSASGYPLNYPKFNEQEKKEILAKKVVEMVYSSLKNANSLGLDRMFSYAGFSSVYIKDKQYLKQSLFPTARFLNVFMRKNLPLDCIKILDFVRIEDLLPGDVVDLPSGEIERGFISGLDYSDDSIRQKSHSYYDTYNIIQSCLSYKKIDESLNIKHVEWFLTKLDEFVIKRVSGVDSHYANLKGKTLELKIKKANEWVRRTIKFGSGLVDNLEKPTKRCIVESNLLQYILNGHALFENLNTGYGAEWERYPNIFNKDITMMLVAFSHVYKNRLAKEFVKT